MKELYLLHNKLYFFLSVLPFFLHPNQTSLQFLINSIEVLCYTQTTQSNMSFLTRTLPRASRTFAAPAPRAFSTSFVTRKSATETVKDAAKTVDRAVADKLVDGIEASQKASVKVKEVAGMNSSEVKGKASEVAGEAQGTAAEVTGEVKGKVNELAGAAKGKAEEIKGKM